MYTNARWADAAHTMILAERGDGATVSVPVDPGNADYRRISLGEDDSPPLAIAAYAPPPITADAVRAEAGRRIYAVYPQWKQANMTARGVELLRTGEANWTAEETAEAAALDAAWAWIKTVRAHSNAMESDPPADYADDSNWPPNPA